MISQQKNVIINLKKVCKSFHKGQEKVLKEVSLAIPRGQLTYVLGASGAGKSLILRHILGLMHPDSGEVWVDGQNLRELNRQQLTHFRLKLGMLFQNAALFDDLTVFENVAFPLREHSTLSEAEIILRVQKTLSLLRMTEGFEKFPNELSGGMRKRVGLARAIIREPAILLYDEPTTGLDPVTRVAVDELIETLKRELQLTSVVISHDLASALLLGDWIAFLDQGKIVFFGTPEEFKASQQSGIQAFLQAGHRLKVG